MCRCIYDIAQKMRETCGYERVRPSVELMSGRAYIPFAAKMVGTKKEKEIPLLLSKCPFCGEEYDKEKTLNEELTVYYKPTNFEKCCESIENMAQCVDVIKSRWTREEIVE